MIQAVFGILLPFIGTAAGAAGVFFIKRRKPYLHTVLSGFAAGVMTAASVWSLLIPAVEESSDMGRFAFVPAVVGMSLGFIVLTVSERFIACMSQEKNKNSGSAYAGKGMLFLAVTVHNFPEGMAVGMMYASLLSGGKGVTASAAFIFAMAIALQNIPEGAIISMPLHSAGVKKSKAFLIGASSGAVEPLGAVITLAATSIAGAFLPYFFGFAAGAMLFVVADELIAEKSEREELPLSALSFGSGFMLMMIMDVALG